MSEPTNAAPLYEGKAKSIYATQTPNEVIQRFKDAATAFNGEKFAELEGKGCLNNKISSILFRILADRGIASHYVATENQRDMRILKVDIVPLEVVVRNVVAGSLKKRLGLDEGTKLAHPIVEFYYKRDDLGDPFISEAHARVLGIATNDEMHFLQEEALRVNGELLSIWNACELDLVDFKLEFGRTSDGILLADEISPDTSRLWTRDTPPRILDKDVFRRDLGDLVEAYSEVYERLQATYPEHDVQSLPPAPARR